MTNGDSPLENGRDSGGRFAPGNSFGKGRPRRFSSSAAAHQLLADMNAADRRIDLLAASIEANELSPGEIYEAIRLEIAAWRARCKRLRALELDVE